MVSIGITCSIDYNLKRNWLGWYYIKAVLAAGGLPLILPNMPVENAEMVLNTIQGLLLSGGGDVDPMHMGEDPRPELGEVDPERDVFEIAITKEALRLDKPVLGICRGAQVLALAAGGKIQQHLDINALRRIKHFQQAPRRYPSHRVSIAENTILHGSVKKREMWVNSFHHQAVKTLPPDFIIGALAPDGVIEALESHKHKFALGVQWHLETMIHSNENFRILQRFIAAST